MTNTHGKIHFSILVPG